MSRFKIAASILAADFGRLADDVRAAEQAGADWIHADVMDGHFVPNLTIGPDIVRACSGASGLPVNVHLMIEEPERYVEMFRGAGASTIGVHVEACANLHRNLQQIRDLGLRASVALNPATPAEAVREVLPCVDQVLVMTVNPGFGGQKFIRETLGKLQTIRKWIDLGGHEIDIVVDGGIDASTVEEVAINGANVFVMGSAFFHSKDYKQFVDEIRSILSPYEEEHTGP
jgi:ribulose-phosphate 3-epimerase